MLSQRKTSVHQKMLWFITFYPHWATDITSFQSLSSSFDFCLSEFVFICSMFRSFILNCKFSLTHCQFRMSFYSLVKSLFTFYIFIFCVLSFKCMASFVGRKLRFGGGLKIKGEWNCFLDLDEIQIVCESMSSQIFYRILKLNSSGILFVVYWDNAIYRNIVELWQMVWVYGDGISWYISIQMSVVILCTLFLVFCPCISNR